MAATIISRLPANFATAPFDYSYEVLGRTLGRSKSEISRALLLLKLPRAVRDDYHLHKPTKKQLWAIAEIEDIDAQIRTWGAVKSAIGVPALLSPSAPEKYDNGDGLDPAPRVETRWENPDVALSTLPKRLARRIQQAHEVLSVLRFEPRSLWNGDWEILNQIREDLNAVIESADKE